MGQEISSAHFSEEDFSEFLARLREETQWLNACYTNGACSHQGNLAGYEVEAWLVDAAMQATPDNTAFLTALDDPLATPELALFNIELNYPPLPLQRGALDTMQRDLDAFLQRVSALAESRGEHLVMIGILPTLRRDQLNLKNMTPLNRYRALNEQILRFRGRPVHLDIVGREHLQYDHNDVMLEAATTSFQLHLQVPFERAHCYYNAAIALSFASVGVAGNSPYLFGRDLWDETRIPLFEQAIEVGGYRGVAQGPLRRVSFGSGYARHSILECFNENLEHFPVLLPRLFDTPVESMSHLRLHNGTIWRWNRPLVGFDPEGTPHFRIEHRVIPTGPTVADMLANAAFYYGLVAFHARPDRSLPLDFASARDNFYQAAKTGLGTHVRWQNGQRITLSQLVCQWLIPQAREGLQSLGISEAEIEHNLCIIAERIETGQTGAQWQRQFLQQHSGDFELMTSVYHANQQGGRPVHQWPVGHV